MVSREVAAKVVGVGPAAGEEQRLVVFRAGLGGTLVPRAHHAPQDVECEQGRARGASPGLGEGVGCAGAGGPHDHGGGEPSTQIVLALKGGACGDGAPQGACGAAGLAGAAGSEGVDRAVAPLATPSEGPAQRDDEPDGVFLGAGWVEEAGIGVGVEGDTVAVAEAMVLGAKAGLDPQQMIDVIRQSTGHSVAFEMRAPRYLSGDFEPGGTVDITWKDQTLQTDFANALGVPLFLANTTRQIFQWARGLGYNKKDSSITVTMYEKAAGVQLGPRKD